MSDVPTARLFSALLIANRGEIAVRIARTCRALGIRSIAVFSTADRDASHAQIADEAYEIGPPPPSDSYLNIDAILAVARATGAEAIHPGYGFLAENATFARAVQAAGIVWVGPSPEVIALLGDKVAAKRLAVEAGVAVVPGYSGEDQSLERLTREAQQIGYPIMLKAAAGGGGRGMRAVGSSDELTSALESARREARAAFGHDRVFLEKLIPTPRHVEIQIMVDARGEGVYLGERDCSLQRRHQKVMEEAPCPVLSAELRARMGADALRLAISAGYLNAGTVEFLLDGERYYFLEVNTRIQVEHPVTEMITGLDLIRLQIEIAAGRPLPIDQAHVTLSGHAFEARIYAEDPDTGFLPSTGTLDAFSPPAGAGIRNDVGVYPGFTVTPYYDPMLAKLIIHGHGREQALGRLQSALREYEIRGPKTNLAFLSWLAERPELATGRVDIEFIDRTWRPADAPTEDISMDVLVAAALSVVANRPSSTALAPGPRDPWESAASWRSFGITRRLWFTTATDPIGVELSAGGANCWTLRCRDRSLLTTLLQSEPGVLAFRIKGRNVRFSVTRNGDVLELSADGRRDVLRLAEVSARSAGGHGGPSGVRPTAPMPGTVVKVAVTAGQQVVAHEPLVVLEAMKMEHVIEAPRAGTVLAVLVAVGDLVAAGAAVVEFEES